MKNTLNIAELRKLALFVDKAQRSPQAATNFSFNDTQVSLEAAEGLLVDELAALSSTRANYERNKMDIFALIEETVDARLPREVANMFDGFTETVNYPLGSQVKVTVRSNNKNARGRGFVTKGAAAGHYEVFKLPADGSYTIETFALVAAIQIAFEDFLTGRVRWSDLLEVVTLGMQDRIYDEIMANLARIEAALPVNSNNKASTPDFDAKALNKVLGVVSAYDTPVIMCTETFAREITEGADWASEAEKVARRNIGHLANYKGAKIVILPQSYTDVSNEVKVVDDSKAYIMPADKGKLFHIALQGPTQVKDRENDDWSKELHTYKRLCVSVYASYDMGTYKITSL